MKSSVVLVRLHISSKISLREWYPRLAALFFFTFWFGVFIKHTGKSVRHPTNGCLSCYATFFFIFIFIIFFFFFIFILFMYM